MNIDRPTAPDELDLTGASRALAAGLPDPAVLTRIANELYQSFQPAMTGGLPPLPQTPEAAEAALMNPVAGLSLPALPASEQITEEALRQSMPAASSFQAPVSPGLPGGISAADFSVMPAFSFLEEARSLFERTAGSPAPLAPAIPQTAQMPTETELRGAAPAMPGIDPTAIPASIPAVPVSAVSTPQIPGPVPGAPAGQSSAFQFLEMSRSISSLNAWNTMDVSPVLSPAGAEFTPGSQPLGFSAGLFDVHAVRRDFPILQEQVHGRPLIWLDNAATTQKPQAVIDRLTYFYQHENSNVHRAAHELAARSTDAYDAAREKVRRFLNAGSTREIVFVRGATEGINLVAQSWGRQHVREGDEIVITHLEHHANIVPWQMLCAESGARLRVAPVDNQGQVLLDEYEKLLGPKTRLVAFAQVSNALGTITPVQEMVAIAHRYGAKVLVDGAQAVSHMKVDVQAYDCDFYVLSGHKVFAPTGIGVVYGKQEVLEATRPWQGGGNMIADVTFEKTLYQSAPFRFEAGTGSIADAVGLGAALDYLDRIGMVNVERYEHELLAYAIEGLQRIPGLHLIGTAREKASVLSFVLDGFTTEEVGQALNREGIAVRSGHHCAQPILRRFGLESTVRPSLALYNTGEECDALVAAIWNLKNGRGAGLI